MINKEGLKRLIEDILANKTAIISKLSMKGGRAINRYKDIQTLFLSSSDIAKDIDFQKKFKSYYNLNFAHLGKDYLDEFFRLFEQQKLCKIGYFNISNKLIKIPTLRNKKTHQLSFISKLLHTCDNCQPIYDRFVRDILTKYGILTVKVSLSDRIKSGELVLQELSNIYNDKLWLKEWGAILGDKDFKSLFGMFSISNVKKYDFILWCFGSL